MKASARMKSSAARGVHIRNILANETYMPDSGLYQMLETALGRLSLDALASLALLVSLKVTEGEQRGRDAGHARAYFGERKK